MLTAFFLQQNASRRIYNCLMSGYRTGFKIRGAASVIGKSSESSASLNLSILYHLMKGSVNGIVNMAGGRFI